MNTVTWFIPAISCNHCTYTIEMEVGELSGVQSVKADKDSRKVTVTFAEPTTEEKIKDLLAGINFPVDVLEI